MTGLEQELKRLQSAIGSPQSGQFTGEAASKQVDAASRTSLIDDTQSNGPTEENIANPPLESSVACNDDGALERAPGMDDSTYAAFDERLLDCVSGLHPKRRIPRPCKPQFKHTALLRSSQPTFELPNRIQASLLIQRALKFIGNDYHLILRKSFFAKLDSAYTPQQPLDRIWTCSLFVLLALGELYSNCHGDRGEAAVPGTQYFLHAVSLLEDSYEDASTDHVKALNLIASTTALILFVWMISDTARAVFLFQRARP